ncbi:MAG: flavodoxin family protein [Bacillota bacterium]
MKIGMMVHSETGHTMDVARAIETALKKEGHEVEVRSVVAKSKRPWKESMPSIEEAPDPNGYDVLILGAPVWGFTLSRVMEEYLFQVRPIETKRLILFSTGALPRFFGGKRAMKIMADISKVPEAKTVYAGSVRFLRNKKPRFKREVVDAAVTAVKTLEHEKD